MLSVCTCKCLCTLILHLTPLNEIFFRIDKEKVQHILFEVPSYLIKKI